MSAPQEPGASRAESAESMSLADLRVHPDLVPPTDPLFVYLYDQVIASRLPAYRDLIPRELVRPFDPDFHPERTPLGAAATRAILGRWVDGFAPEIWVYPDGDGYVSSDDYLVLVAARLGQASHLRCIVIGLRPPIATPAAQLPSDPPSVG